MDEQRKYQRWHPRDRRRVSVTVNGVSGKGEILDVGTGGMRCALTRRPVTGDRIYAALDFFPVPVPFFVLGTVVRTAGSGGRWEAAVKFEKVRTVDFTREMPMTGGRTC